MLFWDTSAIVPLLVDEPRSVDVQRVLRDDSAMVVWWGSIVECESALARLERDGLVKPGDADVARQALVLLSGAWTEVLPTESVRSQAQRALRRHSLRAADALQLAAAAQWAGPSPSPDSGLCTFDHRLAEAARLEGFGLPLSGSTA